MRRAWLVAALLCACRERGAAPVPPAESPAAPAPPERIREQEPNDFQRAQQIPARGGGTGSRGAPRGEEWFRVGVPAGKTLALRIELKLVRDASIEAYDRDRNRLLRVHAGGGDPGIIPALACLEACFLKVSGAGPQDYELAVLGANPGPDEELEPNGRPVDATPLQPGKPMRGTYLSADDEDWYRLELKPSAMDALRIEVTAVPGARPELEVRALADASLLATFRGTDELLVRDLSVHLADLRDGGLGDRGVADGVVADGGDGDGGLTDGGFPAGVAAGGGYYLVLKGHTRRGAPLTQYTITTALEAGAPDLEIEPNDDPQHATPLHDTATGYIAPAGDQDWYRIHSDAPAILHVELTGADRADLEVAVYADGGGEKPRLLARVNEGGPREPEVLPAGGSSAGDRYVLRPAAARPLEGKWGRDGGDRQTPCPLAGPRFAPAPPTPARPTDQ